MGKSLLVVESPAKARTLSRYLGADFIVKATVGHVKDLPQNALGVNVEKGFSPSYKLIRGKTKVLQDIRTAAVGVDAVYLASDPDREGEAIAWHVAEEISRGRKKEDLPPFYRVMLHEITKAGVKRALAAPLQLDRLRYESQLARRILDRLVGYELSPLLWRKVSAGLSAGRVQSVAVALVVDREREILAFEPQEYWVFQVSLDADQPPRFTARLTQIEGEKATVSSEEQARPLQSALDKADYRVLNVKTEEKKRYALPPLITSTLQQDAHRLYRFSAKKTMSIAQRLYEGMDLGAMGTHGLITYMRTDSLRIADEALFAARDYIEKSFGKPFLPSSPNHYKNKKSAQDAHEAIRPTSTDFAPDAVKDFLDRDMFRLYRLIWNRFIASQMSPARFDVTSVQVLADEKWLFEATGRQMLFEGFLKVFKPADTEEEDAAVLPPLAQGQELALAGLESKQQFTQPPPRFTEGTLVKELEKQGIGRPSTYATILSTIQDKQYVVRDKNKFFPTELGSVVTELLRDNFPNIMDVAFTAGMEESLDKIEEGDTKRKDLLQSFWDKFSKSLETARTEMKNVKQQPKQTDLDCPRCSAKLVIRFGKNGAFLACSAFPECRTTMPYVRDENGQPALPKEEISEEKCKECDARLVLRDGRFGRFWACVNYPTCKFTMPYTMDLNCPREKCSGKLVEKRSKKGATYYRCSEKECDFVAFGKLVTSACPECKNAFMEEKGRGQKKTVTCPSCNYSD